MCQLNYKLNRILMSKAIDRYINELILRGSGRAGGGEFGGFSIILLDTFMKY